MTDLTEILARLDALEKTISRLVYVEEELNKLKSKNQPFTKPEFREVNRYFREKNVKGQSERFYNFYESKNWKVGKNKMTQWKSAAANWCLEHAEEPSPQSHKEYVPPPVEVPTVSEEEAAENRKRLKALLGGVDTSIPSDDSLEDKKMKMRRKVAEASQ